MFDFAPNAERVRFLDQRLRADLGASMRYLAEKLEGHLPFPPQKLEQFLQRLAHGPVPPLTFALYSDVVLAIDREDLTEVDLLLQRLFAVPIEHKPLLILELKNRVKDENSDRYIRYIDTDPEMPLDLRPPTPEAAQKSRTLIENAFHLLDRADPTLAAEIRELLREIILCRGGFQFSFDGASSFMLWGAILINAEGARDELSMVQMLAHESAHNLLFGLCPDEPLLQNDPAERYASPLREDLRPLEGIYHATFVIARMHRSIKTLADSGLLSDAQEIEARRDVEANEKKFAQGLATLDKHAEFTEPGRAIMERARVYMAGHRHRQPV